MGISAAIVAAVVGAGVSAGTQVYASNKAESKAKAEQARKQAEQQALLDQKKKDEANAKKLDAAETIRDERRGRQRAAALAGQGRAGTILTGSQGLGTTGEYATGGKTVLGM